MRHNHRRRIVAGRGCNVNCVHNYVTHSPDAIRSGVKIGYGRVSTRDQHPEAQNDALTAAGCDRVFIDKASGKLARCPLLDNALHAGRAGDQLVVTKLDRLGRSLEHLTYLQDRGVNLVVVD